MSKTEVQAAPSPRGLSLLRRNKGNKSSTSLLSDDSHDVSENNNGIKATLDNVIDKVRKSVDEGRRDSEGDVSPHRRLSTMFKRKKKGDKDDNGRRRSSNTPADELSLQPTKSDPSRLQASRSSSLLTDDISDDDQLNLRPTLSAHSSHRGFLTLSSPAVNTQTEPLEEPPSLAALTQPSTVSIPSIIEPDEDEISPIRQSFTFPASHRTSVVSALSGLQSSATASEPVLQQYNTHDERPETPLHLLKISTTEPETPPNRPSTPSTLVTPPTPTLDSHERSESPDRSEKGPRRRRALSGGQPSKLSRSVPAPLTPTVEESKTPGGTVVQPNNATGFFSSVFSAAQKAADQLSHTITVPGAAKSKDEPKTEDTESADAANMTSSTEVSQSQSTTESAAKSEEEAAALAVSNAYEKPNNASLHALQGRPLSIASTERLTLGGERSPSRQADDDDGGFLKRGGSIRSRISTHRRNRGSSTVTANGVGAALKESATGLSQVATSGQGHRMTGFAVASKKRNKDFHQQFRSVPEDDYLIEDYSAALQRDILLHGRLYVSEGHICFSSNILGWVTNLVMSFDEIVAVEKKSTAVIFPNAIVIQTLHAKNTFASFVARDSTYELIIGIWKINHPNLKSSLNGVALEDSGTGDKTEKAESIGSNDSETESDEFYDEDAEDDGKASYVEGDTTKSVNGSDAGDDPISRKPSGAPVGGDSQQSGTSTKAREVNDSAAGNSSAANTSNLGPDTHAPTECEDKDTHYDKPLTDTTIPAPLGKVYSLMFGPGSGAFMGKWLVDDQKSRELDMKDDKIGLDNDHKTMTFSYIKPLGGSVGPKQTKCITTNTVEAYNLEKAVSISCSTQTPDVPSGNAFLTKTKYCLMWGPDNSTRLVANCTVEWSAKSWLKGPIEKGAQDGQTQYVKDLVAALKAAVSTSKPAAKGALKKGKKKGKKDDEEEAPKSEASPSDSASSKSNWGPLEPLHSILEPLLDIVRPFITSQVIIAVLFVLLVYTWISPPGQANQIGLQPYTGAERTAMYEDLWRREENELWDWLEDRVGIDDLYTSKLESIKDRQKVLTGRQMSKKIKDEKMSSRELYEAIKITEQKLDALKGAVESKKEKPAPAASASSASAGRVNA